MQATHFYLILLKEITEVCNVHTEMFHQIFLNTVPFDATIGSSIMSTLAYQEVVYYRFSFPTTGLTLVLDVSYGSVVCYASDSIQNPNRKHGYSLRVEASYYNDSYIDPAVVQGAVGGYLFVGIEGRSNASNNSFSLNGTAGDSATRGT